MWKLKKRLKIEERFDQVYVYDLSKPEPDVDEYFKAEAEKHRLNFKFMVVRCKEKFEFEPNYEEDLAKEHEKYITEYYNCPVFIKDWPKDIKAWYMKVNDDNKTGAAVDLEVPGTGELMGGSEREINYDVLMSKIKDKNIDKDVIDWYISLRKFGNAPHAGFGMGFERLIIYLTGMENIRDVIPFPRTPGNCEY